MLSEIAFLRGAKLTKSETDYRFTPKRTAYFYCDNNHYSLYKSIENLKEQDWNKTGTDRRDVYLITDDELKRPVQMIKDNRTHYEIDKINIDNISVWKLMIYTLLNDIKSDRVRIIFVTGKGRTLSMFVQRLNEICKKEAGKKYIDQAILFPATTEDYIDLTSDIDFVDAIKINNPSEYKEKTIELEISSYFKTYKAELMRGVVILGEDSLDNIKKMRRMADIADQLITNNSFNIYLYCNDGIAISEETIRGQAIKYYGLDEKVIPKVATKILENL